MKDTIQMKGFFRVQIEEEGKLVGDSGWKQNVVTNVGFLNYLVFLLGASAGSQRPGFIALGTGGAPATNATTLAGEVMSSTERGAVTFVSVGSTTAQFTVTFASSDSFVTTGFNISNIGLFASSAENSLFAGNTYTSSALATNQNINATYQIRFS